MLAQLVADGVPAAELGPHFPVTRQPHSKKSWFQALERSHPDYRHRPIRLNRRAQAGCQPRTVACR